MVFLLVRKPGEASSKSDLKKNRSTRIVGPNPIENEVNIAVHALDGKKTKKLGKIC